MKLRRWHSGSGVGIDLSPGVSTRQMPPVTESGGRASWRPAYLLVLLAIAAAGCGGVTPHPRFTPHEKRSAGEVVEELGSRRRAFLSADSNRLMRVVDGYLGVPYKWGGTTRSGMDCSAMTRAIVRETYGLELPRTSGQMYKLGTPVRRGSGLRPGDLVFFRIDTSGPGVSHVGIYVGDGRFAHASSSRGGVIDELAQPYFKTRYVGGRRILPQ